MNSYRQICKKFFTLVELLVVIILLFALAAGTASYLNEADEFRVNTEVRQVAEMVRTHLRYAQTQAMSDEVAEWGVQFGASSYQLYRKEGDVVTNPLLPGSGEAAQALTNATVLPVGTILFDEWGRPLAGELVITVSYQGQSEAITLKALSGKIL